MVKLTLTWVKRTPREGAKGPYTSVSIKCKEYGDKYLSGFGRKENESWKPGDTVEVEAVREVPKDGKIYLNFDMPKTERPSGVSNEKLDELIREMRDFRVLVTKSFQDLHEAMFPTNPDEIPFDEDTGEELPEHLR